MLEHIWILFRILPIRILVILNFYRSFFYRKFHLCILMFSSECASELNWLYFDVSVWRIIYKIIRTLVLMDIWRPKPRLKLKLGFDSRRPYKRTRFNKNNLVSKKSDYSSSNRMPLRDKSLISIFFSLLTKFDNASLSYS